MIGFRVSSAFLLAVSSIVVLDAAAHHSFNFFKSDEGDRFIVAEGTISQIELVNPHSGVYIDVVDENGESTEWLLETRPVIFLYRRGWTQETLQLGQKVTFSGERFRTPNQAWWRAVLVHGVAPESEARLFIETAALAELEARAFEARFEALPRCGDISELCYLVSAEMLQKLRAEFRGNGFLIPTI